VVECGGVAGTEESVRWIHASRNAVTVTINVNQKRAISAMQYSGTMEEDTKWDLVWL
jgi:hypothetical protein